jgi:hypothetical protein
MADKPDFEALQKEKDELQAAFEKEQKKYQAQRSKYAKAKQGLVDFDTKYGRVLKLVAAAAAEEAAAKKAAKKPAEEEAETVTLTADDIGTIDVDEIVSDPPVDTSDEE